tara:strand:+ start:800 stop:1204 length:405 start_codon:yes stop_codon:yes gene_type:complete
MKLFQKENKDLEINIAPLIDIVFLLLIFFMLASEFTDFKTIDLVSPIESNQNIEIKDQPIGIKLFNNGDIIINNTTTNLKNFHKFMKEFLVNNKSKKLVITTTSDTKINILISTIDVIRDFDIENIALITKEKI